MAYFVQYQKARFKEAVSRSWRDFAPTREHIPLFVAIWLVSVALQWVAFGWQSVWSELPLTILRSVGGILGAYGIWLLVCIALAPYRLWLRAQKDKKDHLRRAERLQIAKSLQSHIGKGQALLGQFESLSNRPDVPGWRKEAEVLVERCGEDELAAFKTLYPDSLPIEPEIDEMFAPPQSDRNALKGLIAKSRKIMLRQYALAKEKPPED